MKLLNATPDGLQILILWPSGNREYFYWKESIRSWTRLEKIGSGLVFVAAGKKLNNRLSTLFDNRPF